MRISVTYDRFGKELGYTTVLKKGSNNNRKDLAERFSRLGITFEQIKTLNVDGIEHDPKKLTG